MDEPKQDVTLSASVVKNNRRAKNLNIEKEKNEFEKVSFYSLFRFSTRFDIIILTIGLLSAIGEGAIAPFMLLLISSIIETFSGQRIDHCKFNVTISNMQDCGLNNSLISTNDSAEMIKPNLTSTISPFEQQLHRQSMSLIVSGCISFVLGFLQTSCCTLVSEHQIRRIREKVFRALLKKDISYFDKHATGELSIILTNNINEIHDGIGNKLSITAQLTAKGCIGLIIAFVHGWKMTLVMLSIAPIILIMFMIGSMIFGKVFFQELQAFERAGTIAEEVLSSVRTVLAFNGIEHEQTRYGKHIELARKKSIQKRAVTGLMSGSMYILLFSSYALAFWYGNRLIQNENYDIGKVILVFFSVLTSLFAFGQSMSYHDSIKQARIAAGSVWKLLSLDNEIDSIKQNLSMNNYQGTIKFENVTFCYPSRPDVHVLRGLEFEAAAGETVALVGASGCGKSTCIQLLQRFYQPIEGRILLDGQSIECFDWQELSQKIGVVNQEPVLFSTTILKNIQYGRAGASYADIQTAAIAANAHNFIMSLPDKYETLVGEHGAQLSGGERQRIVLARALVRNPMLLLLDEATSALDNQNEKIVQQAIENASQKRTTIIIAHRLSTVRNADKIIVIDNGVVVEQGNHETLIKRKAIYYALVQAQTFDNLSEDEHLKTIDSSPFIEDHEESVSDNEMTVLQRETNATEHSSTKEIRWPTWEILKLNKPEIILIIIGASASIFNGCLEPLSAVLLSETIKVYQECKIQDQNQKIRFYSMMFIGLGIVSFITKFTQDFMFACSGEALTKRLRAKAFAAILRQEIAWFDQAENSTGALCTRLSNEASAIQGISGIRIGTLLTSFASLSVAMIVAFLFGWKLSLVALAFLPFMVLSGFLQGFMKIGYSRKESKTFESAGSLAIQVLQSIRTVRQLAIEKQFINDYCHLLDIPYKSSLKRIHILAFLHSLIMSATFFCMAALFSYGNILITQNEMTFENVMMVVNCMLFGTQTVGQNAGMALDYGKAAVAAKKMLSLFAQESKMADISCGLKMENFTGDLSIKSVNFAYATRPHILILDNFNLDIKAGQRIALVGTSGNGKSTILHLLQRFYDVQSGSIFVDSKNLRTINLNWWRSQLGIVTQEPILFNRSIAENLAYGDLSRQVTREEMIEAAKNANIHEFIEQLPQGYETCVGAKGSQLSGGEKQRIAICRVLIRNPKIILLDEPTSALDCQNEKIINEVLSRAMLDRTSIVVAHRLSTIQDADIICVLQHGHIIENGKHHDLIARKGHYYQLIQCTEEKDKIVIH